MILFSLNSHYTKLKTYISNIFSDQAIEVIASRPEETEQEAYNPSTYYNTKQPEYNIPGLNSQYSSLAQSSTDMYTNDSDYKQTSYEGSRPYLNNQMPGPPLPVPHPTSTTTETSNFDSTWNMDMSWMSTNSYNDSDDASSFLNESACGVTDSDEKFPIEQATEDVDHRQIIIPEETQILNIPILQSMF